MPRPPIVAAAILLAASAACTRTPAAVATPPAPVTSHDTVTLVVARPDTVPSSEAVREYRGSFSSGYEISWFTPCDATPGDSMWWVTLTEDARLQRDSLLRLLPTRPHHGLAVRWRGTVSARMPAGAGHMGRGSRYMLVTSIISLRPLDENGGGACGSEGRVGIRD